MRRIAPIALASALAVGLVFLLAAPRGRALDAEPWERVLAAHAHRGGVDYAALRSDPRARADLERFLDAVAGMPDGEPLSAWLNAYNALVVAAIVERDDLRSVREVPGFFDRVARPVAGRRRTLDEVEHGVIRHRFRDARVHVALNCGARSCPPLHGRAFREGTLDATLDHLSRELVASPSYVRVRGRALVASRIFEWFEADFRRDAGSVLAWIRRYDVGGRTEGLEPNGAVGAMPYDWRLNDQPRHPGD